MEVLTVIPARGGSKGVPRKNLLACGGVPLIVRAIRAAIESQYVSRIVVSTDDDEIMTAAQNAGAETIRRPPEISGDSASSEEALHHVLAHLQEKEDYAPDLLVFLQCTAPLMLPDDIDGCVRLLLNCHADTAFCGAPFHSFLWSVDKDGLAEGVNHRKGIRPLRQELKDQQFLEAGSVYVIKVEGFLRYRHRFFGKTVLFPIPRSRCIEIDEPGDFVIAEAMLNDLAGPLKWHHLPEKTEAIICDFDGVLTDNRVTVHQDGTEAVVCNRSDGLAISQIRNCNVLFLVLSTEQNPVVAARCKKLGIVCKQGCNDKIAALRQWLEQEKVVRENVIYIGNDMNDIDCMINVGCGIAVADAYPEVVRAAQIVLQAAGGSGAVREVFDLLQQKWRNAT